MGWSYSKCSVALGPPTYAAFVTCGYNFVYYNCKLQEAIFVGACMHGNKGYNYVTITGNKESIHAGSAKVYNIYVTLICQTTHGSGNI